jgi:hypothetical protein
MKGPTAMTSYPGDWSPTTSSVPWRKARLSPDGPNAACVQATPALLKPDGAVVVDLAGVPPIVLMHAFTDGAAGQGSKDVSTPFPSASAEPAVAVDPSAWTKSSLDDFDDEPAKALGLTLDQLGPFAAKGLPGFSSDRDSSAGALSEHGSEHGSELGSEHGSALGSQHGSADERDQALVDEPRIPSVLGPEPLELDSRQWGPQVQVPPDGYCTLSGVIATDPLAVHAVLYRPDRPGEQQRALNWLLDPTAVRAEVSGPGGLRSENLALTREMLIHHLADEYLGDAQLHDLPYPLAVAMGHGEEHDLPAVPGQMDVSELRDAVLDWGNRWNGDAGELFLHLLGHALDRHVRVFLPGMRDDTVRFAVAGPTDAPPLHLYRRRSPEHINASAQWPLSPFVPRTVARPDQTLDTDTLHEDLDSPRLSPLSDHDDEYDYVYDAAASPYRETLAEDLAGLHVSPDQISRILAQYDDRAAAGDADRLTRFDQQVADAMRMMTRLQEIAEKQPVGNGSTAATLGEHVSSLDRALVLPPDRMATWLRDVGVSQRDIPSFVDDYAAAVRSGDSAALDAFTDRIDEHLVGVNERAGPQFVQAFVRDMRIAGVPDDEILTRVMEYGDLRPGDEEGQAAFDTDLASDLRRYAPPASDTSLTGNGTRGDGPETRFATSLVLSPERLVGYLRGLGVDEADIRGFVHEYDDAVHSGDPTALADFGTGLGDYIQSRPGLPQGLHMGGRQDEGVPSDYLDGLVRDLRGLRLPEDAIATRVAQYQRLARRGDPQELTAFDENMADLMANLQAERDREALLSNEFVGAFTRDLREVRAPEETITDLVADYQRAVETGNQNAVDAFDARLAEEMDKAERALALTGAPQSDQSDQPEALAEGEAKHGTPPPPTDTVGGLRRPRPNRPGDSTQGGRRDPVPRPGNGMAQENNTIVLERPKPSDGLFGGGGGPDDWLSDLLNGHEGEGEGDGEPATETLTETKQATEQETETETATQFEEVIDKPPTVDEIADSLLENLKQDEPPKPKAPADDAQLTPKLPTDDAQLKPKAPATLKSPASTTETAATTKTPETTASLEPPHSKSEPEPDSEPHSVSEQQEQAWQDLVTELRTSHPGTVATREAMTRAEYNDLLEQRAQSAIVDATDSYSDNPVNSLIGFDYYVAHHVAQAMDDARDDAFSALGIDPSQVSIDAVHPTASVPAKAKAQDGTGKGKGKGKAKVEPTDEPTDDELAETQSPPALSVTPADHQEAIDEAWEERSAAGEGLRETDRRLRRFGSGGGDAVRDPRPELEQRRTDHLSDLHAAEQRLRSLGERLPGDPALPDLSERQRPRPTSRPSGSTREQRRQRVRRNQYGIKRNPLETIPEGETSLPPLPHGTPPIDEQDPGGQEIVTPPPGPWYTEAGALGEYSVSDLHLPDDPFAAGLDVSRGVRAPENFDAHTAREITSRVGGAVSEMLTRPVNSTEETRRETWQREYLRMGRFLTVDGHSVWVRPVVDTLTHIPAPPPGPDGPGAREYQVNFGGPARESGTETELAKGLEGVFEGALNLGGAHLSSLTPLAPTFTVDSKRTRNTASSTQNVSGRKLMSAGSTEFGAGLKFRVYVDGHEWDSAAALDDLVDLKFPNAFSGAMDNRPDVSTRVANVALPNYRSPHARVMISAIDPAPFVAELQRQLHEAKVPAASVNNMTEKLMEEMLSETSIRNRERWWISSGDVSSKMHQGTGTFSAFEGDFTATVKIKRLENITDDNPTDQVRLRDDIGLAFSRARGRGQSSSAALNVLFDFGGMHALEGSKNDLGYLIAGVSATSERAHSSALGNGSMNKTTLMRDTVQERYRAEVEVTIATSSSTHRVAPAVSRTIAEIDVPQTEAAEFEHTVLGRVETPRLALHHTPASVQNLPNVQHVLRGAAELGVLPTLHEQRPDNLINPANWAPDPQEPLALRSRSGQSFGMLLSLPGSERVYHAATSILHNKVAAKQSRVRRTTRAAGLAHGVDWSQAHRDLSSHFGTPALEGDMQVLLSGIDHSLKIDGVKYDVSVVGYMGRRVEQQTYDLTVNARATGGDSITSTRNRIKALSVFFAGSARFKLRDFVKFEAGDFGLEGSYGWNRSTSLTSGSKTYRRTETVGEVTDNTYGMVYELKIRTGGKGGEVETWYIHGDDVVGRFAIPKQHKPAATDTTTTTTTTTSAPEFTTSSTPATQPPVHAPAPVPEMIQPARVGAPRPAAGPLDFSTARTDGLYPVFSNIPELARTAGHLYQDLNGIPRTDDRWDWPEAIRSMSTPTSLQNGFDPAVGERGWTVRLPDHDGWKQAVKYELSLHDTEHEKEHFDDKSVPAADGSGAVTKVEGDGEVEIEWYQQSVGHVSEGKGDDREIAGSVGLGPIFTPGKEDDKSNGGVNGTSRKAANQVSINVSAGKSYKTSKLTTQKNGSIDVTRTTYSGPVHAYRSNPYFKITVMRWKDGVKGRREQSGSETVYAPRALEFIIPEQRAQDLGLPLARGAAPQVRTQSRQPGQPVLAMRDPELAMSMSHPELLNADEVFHALVDTLRRHGLMPEPTAQIPDGRPNDLMEYLEKRFGSRALQNEFVNLRRTGVVGWYPIPMHLGAGQHLWVRVTGTPRGVTSSRPREDVKLTIRAENFSETEQEQGIEHGSSALFHTQGYASIGEVRLGAGFEGGYSSSSERSERETTAKRDIFRIGTSDKSVEFNMGMDYKLEVGVSTEPPEIARLPLQAAKKMMFGAADLLAKNELGGEGMREFWYENRPWHWFETITDRPDPPVGHAADDADPAAAHAAPARVPLSGSARLLTPAHQTETAPRHKPIVAPSEGEDVAWIPKPPANAVHSPALPRGAYERLRDKIHPNTVPATHAMGKWAGLTTVPEYRRNPDLSRHEATSVPELSLDTLPGLQLSYLTSDTVTRADIVKLLDHQHTVPVRGKNVHIGVDIVNAKRVNSTTFKARRYGQQETEPGGEQKSSGGWGYALQFIGGRSNDTDSRIFESEPAYKGGQMTTALSGAHAGEIDENDREEKVGYYYYAMDVDVLIDGPNGTLKLRVPDGLYAMMPERDGAYLEQHAPWVFGEAPKQDQDRDRDQDQDRDQDDAVPRRTDRDALDPSTDQAPSTEDPLADWLVWQSSREFAEPTVELGTSTLPLSAPRSADITSGMNDPRVLDVKIGASTASRHELMRKLRGGSAWLKKKRSQAVDWSTGSSTRGYRVVGGTGLEGGHAAEIGRNSKTHLRTYVESLAAHDSPEGSVEDLAAALRDKVREIGDTAERTGDAFVGASVVMAVDRRPGGSGDAAQVKLANVEHAFKVDDPGMSAEQHAKYAANFRAGIDSLARELDAIAGGRSPRPSTAPSIEVPASKADLHAPSIEVPESEADLHAPSLEAEADTRHVAFTPATLSGFDDASRTERTERTDELGQRIDQRMPEPELEPLSAEESALRVPTPIDYQGPWRRSTQCATVNGVGACVSVAVITLRTGRESSSGE